MIADAPDTALSQRRGLASNVKSALPQVKAARPPRIDLYEIAGKVGQSAIVDRIRSIAWQACICAWDARLLQNVSVSSSVRHAKQASRFQM
jgi:hypothetical protein